VALPLYMDVHVRRAVSVALTERGVDVVTAQADGAAQLLDPDLLDRATSLGRVLFSQDEDLLAEARRRQRAGQFFSGVVYAHQLYVTIGQCVKDLEIIARSANPKTWPIASSSCRCNWRHRHHSRAWPAALEWMEAGRLVQAPLCQAYSKMLD
jgi:hypothetical protein